MWPPQILMYMLPNLPFLTLLLFYSIAIWATFRRWHHPCRWQNSAPLEAKREFIWTRGVRNSITPSEVACPEFDICMCSMYAQRPTSTACIITSLSDRHGSRQKPKRQFFPPRLNDDAAWQTSPSLSPSPTFVPLMMIDVGPNGLTRIWTHPPTPKPPFPRPGYFFPARPPVRSLSTSLYTAIQGCRQCSHPRATIATDQFFAPARQVPFTPSPVGSAPLSIADSFNSDNYGSINKKIVDSPPSFDFSVWFSLLEMGKFWNVDLPKRKKEKKKESSKICGMLEDPFAACMRVCLSPFFSALMFLYVT